MTRHNHDPVAGRSATGPGLRRAGRPQGLPMRTASTAENPWRILR